MNEIYISTIAFALLGAFANLLLKYRSAKEWLRYKTFKVLASGLIAGLLYAEGRIQYGWPDSILSFAVGHMGLDYINFIMERLGARRGERT